MTHSIRGRYNYLNTTQYNSIQYIYTYAYIYTHAHNYSYRCVYACFDTDVSFVGGVGVRRV